jgi:murein L,D-transpeptidase YcbB/YkuD
MNKRVLFKTVFFIFVLILQWAHVCFSESKADRHSLLESTRGQLKLLMNETDRRNASTLKSDTIYSFEMLVRFYKGRDYLPAWINDKGLSTHSGDLIKSIVMADEHGLISEYYHLNTIKRLIKQFQNNMETPPHINSVYLAKLEMLLTDAFLTMGCHFSGGCVTPLTSETEWHANSDDLDVGLVLENALRENNIQGRLYQLLPPQAGYRRLRDVLPLYRNIVSRGGWQIIPENISLKKGNKSSVIRDVRKRLIASGDLIYDKKENKITFDGNLKQAIIKFQKRHGLDPDGIVGRLTLQAMNVPAVTRLRQIELNLERMRWISNSLGHNYIQINIADFKLTVVENDKSVISMDVIVGKPYWHTPVLSEILTHIVINPYWKVPDSIAGEELLPKIKENPGYLAKHNIKILSNWESDADEIDPRSISWYDIDADDFLYKFRQEPGPFNPLGRIKFMFPNRFNVYLHDTPGKAQFSKNVRSFSHGCIRVSRPVDLAQYLLRDDPDWTRHKILTAIESEKRQTVQLIVPVQIHLLYLTSWVDNEGDIHFRDDIYNRDERLYKVLLSKIPRLTSASKLMFIIR